VADDGAVRAKGRVERAITIVAGGGGVESGINSRIANDHHFSIRLEGDVSTKAAVGAESGLHFATDAESRIEIAGAGGGRLKQGRE
jgi:hypothetical protein